MEETIGETSPVEPVALSETEKQSTKPWFKIVGFAVLGLVLTVGSFFAGIQVGKKQTQPVTQPTSTPPVITMPIPTPTIVITPTSDSTADWKTYTNREFKYQLRYPVDWKIAVEGAGDLETAFAPTLESPCNYSEGDICVNLDIMPSGEYKEGKSLKDYFGERFGMAINVKQTKLDNEEALEIEYYNQRTNHPYKEPFIRTIAIHNKTVFTLTFGESSKNQIDSWHFKETF